VKQLDQKIVDALGGKIDRNPKRLSYFVHGLLEASFRTIADIQKHLESSGEEIVSLVKYSYELLPMIPPGNRDIARGGSVLGLVYLRLAKQGNAAAFLSLWKMLGTSAPCEDLGLAEKLVAKFGQSAPG
jgi:hypothetical protein